MKKILLLFTIALAAMPLFAANNPDDEVTLSNVQVSREKTTFVVTYDISLGSDLRSCDIAFMLSTDAGQTFCAVEKKHLSGDFGKVKVSGTKTIQYDFSQDMEKLDGKQLSFKVEVKRKDVVERNILVTGQVSVAPSVTYGAMVGMVNKWGWYAKFRSDFRFPSAAYEYSTSEGRFWGTGESQTSRLNITAGTMVRAARWLYPYLGLGYGNRSLYLKDIGGEWAIVTDRSTKGLSFDAGVVLKFGKVAVSAGVSNTMLKYTEAEVGVGIMF
ncbi:MAG: hypothetical protein KBS36_00995 [Bacteroidales bacterium]|nr:hypothetical protein [Candidatus Cryptobacteroides fimicaballi]